MLRNYFRIAARQILKSKTFSLINVAGLAVGIAASFLILQYVAFEMSYDQFHRNKDEIYRVALEQYENGELKNASARNFAGINALLTENCPEVTAATRFMKMPANTGFLFRYNNKIYNESGGHITADGNFFKVFPSLLLRGDMSTVLASPNSIVLSAAIAKKVFGDVDPVGQRFDAMDEDRNAPYVVTGILRDIPGNSHFHANFVTKIEEVWPEIVEEDWGATFIFSYATMPTKTDLRAVTDKVNYALRKIAEENPRVKGSEVLFQPITDIHLKSGLKDEYEANGSEALVLILIGIAVVILAIAWINYVNITTARFLRRTKEVGVRRIIGSAKSDLALQFLIEYLCISAIACVLAAALIILLLPYSSSITGIPFHEIGWSIPEVWISALVVFAIGSAVAGTYPAIFLIRLHPMAAIKGNTGGVRQGRAIRRSLVGLQFISSMILIGILTVINAQLGFMRQTDKKIDVEKVITLRNPTAYANQEVKDKHDHFRLLEHRLLQNSSIKMLSTSSAIPGAEIGFTFVDLIKRTRSDPYNPIRFKTIFVGEMYIAL
jgi:putative ABC transport system permease protein